MKGINMEIQNFELAEVSYDQIKYVVLLSVYKEQFVIIRNKESNLWELPGGKREEGELLLKAASRELFEETGASIFELTPYSIYLMNGSYGMNFYVEIEQLGELPEYEIEELKLTKTLPNDLKYGEIYYKMYEQWLKVKNNKEFKKYKINYKEKHNHYDF